MSLLELFCAVDDFCKTMDEGQTGHLLPRGAERQRSADYHDPFSQSQYRDFKAYYQQHVAVYLRAEFPQLISYARFVQRMPRLLGWLCLYLSPFRK